MRTWESLTDWSLIDAVSSTRSYDQPILIDSTILYRCPCANYFFHRRVSNSSKHIIQLAVHNFTCDFVFHLVSPGPIGCRPCLFRSVAILPCCRPLIREYVTIPLTTPHATGCSRQVAQPVNNNSKGRYFINFRCLAFR